MDFKFNDCQSVFGVATEINLHYPPVRASVVAHDLVMGIFTPPVEVYIRFSDSRQMWGVSTMDSGRYIDTCWHKKDNLHLALRDAQNRVLMEEMDDKDHIFVNATLADMEIKNANVAIVGATMKWQLNGNTDGSWLELKNMIAEQREVAHV